MERKSTTVAPGEPQEPDLSRKGMRLLTAGLTSEGDTFLLGAAAVLLTGLLYPVAGPWSLLAFVVVPASALLVRSHRRRIRREGGDSDQARRAGGRPEPQ